MRFPDDSESSRNSFCRFSYAIRLHLAENDDEVRKHVAQGNKYFNRYTRTDSPYDGALTLHEYIQAAELGHVGSLRFIGLMFKKGTMGISKQWFRGSTYLKKADELDQSHLYSTRLTPRGYSPLLSYDHKKQD